MSAVLIINLPPIDFKSSTCYDLLTIQISGIFILIVNLRSILPSADAAALWIIALVCDDFLAISHMARVVRGFTKKEAACKGEIFSVIRVN